MTQEMPERIWAIKNASDLTCLVSENCKYFNPSPYILASRYNEIEEENRKLREALEKPVHIKMTLPDFETNKTLYEDPIFYCSITNGKPHHAYVEQLPRKDAGYIQTKG